MKNMFFQDLRRSFLSKGFAVGILFAFALLYPPVFLESNLSGVRSYLDTLGNAFHASAFPQLAALFPGLAYAAVFCEEYHSGYLGMVITRSGYRNYAGARIGAVALSGGVMLAVPVGVTCIIAYATGTHGIPSGSDRGLLAGAQILYYVETYGDWFVLVGKTLCAFLGGALWALVGLAFAVWVRNRYVAILAPFILYDSLWMLCNYTFLDPLCLLVGDYSALGCYPEAIVLQTVYIVITVLIIDRGMRRALS